MLSTALGVVGALGIVVAVVIIVDLAVRRWLMERRSSVHASPDAQEDPIIAIIAALDRNTNASRAVTAAINDLYGELKLQRIDQSIAESKANISARKPITEPSTEAPREASSTPLRDTDVGMVLPSVPPEDDALPVPSRPAIPPPPYVPEEHAPSA